MAGSNLSSPAPSQHPSHENIAPLESVVTEEVSVFDINAVDTAIHPEPVTRPASTQALPRSHSWERSNVPNIPPPIFGLSVGLVPD